MDCRTAFSTGTNRCTWGPALYNECQYVICLPVRSRARLYAGSCSNVHNTHGRRIDDVLPFHTRNQAAHTHTSGSDRLSTCIRRIMTKLITCTCQNIDQSIHMYTADRDQIIYMATSDPDRTIHMYTSDVIKLVLCIYQLVTRLFTSIPS